jgi:hypothetical protein
MAGRRRAIPRRLPARYHGGMGLAQRWRQFRQKRAEAREARRLLRGLFECPDLRRVSSLRPDHRRRAQFLDWETAGGEVVRVRFGLVRHPRPLRLRGVHHEVIEIYVYDVRAGTVEVVASHNVTRKGKPQQPAS